LTGAEITRAHLGKATLKVTTKIQEGTKLRSRHKQPARLTIKNTGFARINLELKPVPGLV
jgi:hypothetical protein